MPQEHAWHTPRNFASIQERGGVQRERQGYFIELCGRDAALPSLERFEQWQRHAASTGKILQRTMLALAGGPDDATDTFNHVWICSMSHQIPQSL